MRVILDNFGNVFLSPSALNIVVMPWSSAFSVDKDVVITGIASSYVTSNNSHMFPASCRIVSLSASSVWDLNSMSLNVGRTQISAFEKFTHGSFIHQYHLVRLRSRFSKRCPSFIFTRDDNMNTFIGKEKVFQISSFSFKYNS